MGAAAIISLAEVRERKQRAEFRRQLHERVDHWCEALEEKVREPNPTFAHLTRAVWELRQELTGNVTEALVEHRWRAEQERTSAPCPHCGRAVAARGVVSRTVETLVGEGALARPYFYCVPCGQGFAPLDTALGVAPGRKQFDVQQAVARLTAEVPYETACELGMELTGVKVSAQTAHTLTNEVAAGVGVLEVAPRREEIAAKVAEVAAGKHRQPIMGLAIDGAHVPTRPEQAKGSRAGRKKQRANRAHWPGEWREAKGFRFYLVAGDRIVHVLSWHQSGEEAELFGALEQVKEAGLIPEEQVRLCVVADGAQWSGARVQALLPTAREILEYYHCSQHVHTVAHAQYGEHPAKALEWVEGTITRLFLGEVNHGVGGLKRRPPATGKAGAEITTLITYLQNHRHRVDYGTRRRGGYPLGSGGIESAHKFICHVRLKRSGAWWYVANGNHMLALRCAKYNGPFEQVFKRYQQIVLEQSRQKSVKK
jgi:hypothetical protein